MRVHRSDKFGKVRYAGFYGEQRVTQWLPSVNDAESQFIGRVREGKVDPRGIDEKMKDSICEELADLGFVEVDLDDAESPAEQLAYALTEMRHQNIPHEVRARFAQIATCTPNASTRWVLQSE